MTAMPLFGRPSRRPPDGTRRTARNWTVASAVLFVLALGFALRGGWAMFAWDIGETCHHQHGQDWDPEFSRESVFPMSRPCNAHYDLVPSYVNPAIAVCAAGAAVSAAMAVGAAVRESRRQRTACRTHTLGST
ncbi:hypothetical protein C3486_25255 [Streptomyces sp. Ru73]|uniref:hypothetical protein n=1 Tax=Streptomyces sp. Ru73 TaxID=2080748 RepID=UPI000CDCF3BC|nr:hypothetical protein [Streptomyces sp. Ru73]POX38017.1 hypothetical protein C3486_25255 [Streptomyces sp. Ru73]